MKHFNIVPFLVVFFGARVCATALPHSSVDVCRISPGVWRLVACNAVPKSDHGLLPKSAVQFCTRVSGVLGLATPRLVTNRLPSGATSYKPNPSGNLKRACSLRAAKLLPLPSTSAAIICLPGPQIKDFLAVPSPPGDSASAGRNLSICHALGWLRPRALYLKP